MPLTASFHGWSKASLPPAHGVYTPKETASSERCEERSGAEDGIRTRDLLLGKEMLYR